MSRRARHDRQEKQDREHASGPEQDAGYPSAVKNTNTRADCFGTQQTTVTHQYPPAASCFFPAPVALSYCPTNRMGRPSLTPPKREPEDPVRRDRYRLTGHILRREEMPDTPVCRRLKKNNATISDQMKRPPSAFKFTFMRHEGGREYGIRWMTNAMHAARPCIRRNRPVYSLHF
ncbi:hypothetical protein [Methanogenium sp. MK-MG]|uniref:hypothetical protein n=1 Tax=Methanogenium sp. MK-MG TaxID=2599926 RepID=UPI0013EA26FC|nr:hypothetical protein [Methanogenium sp. MK-MG]KAF1074805.1 hypothetical protein MKMG_01878 [Methanogenium sp. MK-MG]